jgi:hypothetical protein
MSGSQPFVRDVPTPRDPAPPRADASAGKANSDLVAWYAEGFSDRIGDRLQLFDSTGPGLELLRFNPLLTANPAFESALRASVAALDDFQHPSYARVRKVTVLEEPGTQLALVSELVAGERLSKVLKAARLSGLRANAGAAIYLLRRLLPTVAELHARHVAHGLLTHDRIVVSPQGEFFITEHVLAGAVGALTLSADEMWQRFGIATASAGPASPGGDVMQVALLALTLLVDRPLGPEDYPRGLLPLMREASARLLTGDGIVLQMWFRRALGLEEPAFADAGDAMAALDALLWDAPGQWNAGLLPGATAETAAAAPSLPVVRQEPAPVQRPTTRPGSILFPPVPASAPRAEPQSARAVRRLRWAAVVFGILALGEGVGLALLLMRGPLAVADTPATRPAATVGAADPAASRTQPLAVTPAPAVPSATQPAQASLQTPPLQPPVSSMADPPPVPLTSRAAAVPAPATRAPARSETRAAPPRPRPAPAANCWLAIDSTVEMRVFSDGRLIGSAARGRFPLTPGSHEIILVNETEQFRSTQTVELAEGATVTITPTIASP